MIRNNGKFKVGNPGIITTGNSAYRYRRKSKRKRKKGDIYLFKVTKHRANADYDCCMCNRKISKGDQYLRSKLNSYIYRWKLYDKMKWWHGRVSLKDVLNKQNNHKLISHTTEFYYHLQKIEGMTQTEINAIYYNGQLKLKFCDHNCYNNARKTKRIPFELKFINEINRLVKTGVSDVKECMKRIETNT